MLLNPYRFDSGGPVLGGTNVLAGLPSTTFNSVASPASFTATRVNDGILLNQGGTIVNTAFLSTLTNSVGDNDGKGVRITFATAKRLGRMRLSCYDVSNGVNCSFQVEAFVGGVWVSAGAPTPNTSPGGFALRNINFNFDASISSTQWRLVISNWNSSNTNNFYAGELEAYEYI